MAWNSGGKGHGDAKALSQHESWASDNHCYSEQEYW
jgi:hypothetical protein